MLAPRAGSRHTMPHPPKPILGSVVDANGQPTCVPDDVYSWLASSLRYERDCLDQRHQEILGNFVKLLNGEPCEVEILEPAVQIPRVTKADLDIIAANQCQPAAKGQADALAWNKTMISQVDENLAATFAAGKYSQSSTPETFPGKDSTIEDSSPRKGSRAPSDESGAPVRTESKVESCNSDRSPMKASSSRKTTLAFVEQELDPSHRIYNIVMNPRFESFFGFLIAVFAMLIAMETQYQGYEVGYQVGYEGYTEGKQDVWPWGAIFFQFIDITFGILFTVEVVLKLIGLRMEFVRDYWNFFDSIIVITWILTSVGISSLDFSPMVLRIARLLRLLRLVKLVKTIKEFDALYLMTESIKGSLSVLVWTVLLLTTIQMLIACILQQFLEEYIMDESNPEEARLEVYKFYGTFARCMLTMFEITLGNWMPPCRALVENVSEWYMLFSLAHKLIIGYSVVSVITGVFIQETFKVATTDDQIMLNQKDRNIRIHTQKMDALFTFADVSADGMLDAAEFEDVVSHPAVKKWLACMELDATDVPKLWELLDIAGDSDGKLTCKELVTGASRLRGNAKSIDLINLTDQQQKMDKKVQRINDILDKLCPDLCPRPDVPTSRETTDRSEVA